MASPTLMSPPATVPESRDRGFASCWPAVASHAPETWDQLKRRARETSRAADVRLCIVRHGQTTNNANGLVSGTFDAPLTAKGQRAAQVVAEVLADQRFDAAFHSGLSRSRDTLAAILGQDAMASSSVFLDSRLAERSLGVLEQTPARRIPEFASGDLNYAPEGGESYLSVVARSFQFLLDVREAAAASGRSQVLVCTHVGPMRVIAGILEERRDPVEVLNEYFANTTPVWFDASKLRFPSFAESYLSR